MTFCLAALKINFQNLIAPQRHKQSVELNLNIATVSSSLLFQNKYLWHAETFKFDLSF